MLTVLNINHILCLYMEDGKDKDAWALIDKHKHISWFMTIHNYFILTTNLFS